MTDRVLKAARVKRVGTPSGNFLHRVELLWHPSAKGWETVLTTPFRDEAYKRMSRWCEGMDLDFLEDERIVRSWTHNGFYESHLKPKDD